MWMLMSMVMMKENITSNRASREVYIDGQEATTALEFTDDSVLSWHRLIISAKAAVAQRPPKCG
jgi:hypothetical protein